MKFAPAEAAGQVCQPISWSPITWPVPRSDLATSTSTVASGGGGGGALGASGVPAAARQHGGNAAGGKSNTEYDEARGVS